MNSSTSHSLSANQAPVKKKQAQTGFFALPDGKIQCRLYQPGFIPPPAGKTGGIRVAGAVLGTDTGEADAP